jgi:hypothetical protein
MNKEFHDIFFSHLTKNRKTEIRKTPMKHLETTWELFSEITHSRKYKEGGRHVFFLATSRSRIAW